MAVGEWGEARAEAALRAKGLRILGRRVRVGRRDELDLIAQAGAVLVFVEVKTRASETFGRPFCAVTRAKRRALSRAAMRYLQRLRPKPPYFRFDVVEVIGSPKGPTAEVRHIENAFALEGNYRITW